MPELVSFDLRRCHIGGEFLAKQKFIKRLHGLRVEGVKDISPVLKAIAEGKNIEILFLGDNTFSSDDISSILAMQDLRDLSLVNCSIDNEQLNRLAALKKITRMNLDQCGRLDQSSLETLVKFKNLETLIVPEVLLSDQNEQYLKRRMPNLRQIR